VTYQDHAAAVLALLAADAGPPALVVYDGVVPAVPAAPKPPYVVVYFAFDLPEAAQDPQTSSLVMTSNRVDCSIYCHCVGANGAASRSVAARVRVALLDVIPAVAGRAAFPIRHTENQPATRDETTGVLVMDQVDTYRLSTVPG
jgi:hypothetical protein